MRGGLNLDEAARYLGVSRRTVERLVAEPSIGVVRIGQGRGSSLSGYRRQTATWPTTRNRRSAPRQSGCADGRGEDR